MSSFLVFSAAQTGLFRSFAEDITCPWPKVGVSHIATIIIKGEGEKEMCKQFGDHVKSTILVILTKYLGIQGPSCKRRLKKCHIRNDT